MGFGKAVVGAGWILKGQPLLHCAAPFSDPCLIRSRRQRVCSRENGVVGLDEGTLSENLKDAGLERKETNNGDAEIFSSDNEMNSGHC